jgi:hypothetical protein
MTVYILDPLVFIGESSQTTTPSREEGYYGCVLGVEL